MKKRLLVMPLMVISTLISCGGGGGDGDFTVTISKLDGLTIDKQTAKKGEDFIACIKVNSEGWALPLKLTSVTIGDKEAKADESYTYELEHSTIANFIIPAANVTGNIDIKLSLDDTKVTEDEFNDALEFKNVEYLQVVKYSLLTPTILETSPTVCHLARQGEGFHESYVQRTPSAGGDYEWKGYERSTLEGNFTEIVEDDDCKDYFLEPQHQEITITPDLKGHTLKDFKFISNQYMTNFVDPDLGRISLSIMFRSKRVSVYKRQCGDGNYFLVTHSYEEYTPGFPPQPINA